LAGISQVFAPLRDFDAVYVGSRCLRDLRLLPLMLQERRYTGHGSTYTWCK